MDVSSFHGDLSGKRKQPEKTHTSPNKKKKVPIGDKVKLLAAVMPLNKERTHDVFLKEAAEYIRFLRAQIAVLKSLPEDSGDDWQQLLHIIVTSPETQAVLAAKRLCICTMKQKELRGPHGDQHTHHMI